MGLKQGGTTANGNPNHGRSMQRKHGKSSCSICGRSYGMAWAKDNHERLCKEYEESIEKKKVLE